MTAIVSERLSSALADRYRVERELGAGGMATVYLARDLKHERDVATTYWIARRWREAMRSSTLTTFQSDALRGHASPTQSAAARRRSSTA